MATQIDATYVLERRGIRIVLNDPTDPDFIGYLDGDDGIAGLDGADVRENADVITGDHGGVHGQFFAGRRAVALKGIIWPDPRIEANRRIDRLQFVTDALQDDLLMRWTEEGSPEKMLLLRAQQRTRISSRRPKAFLAALVCSDHRIYASSPSTLILTPTGSATLGGIIAPVTSPMRVSGGAGIGATAVVNQGNLATPPLLRIEGPITNPVIRNTTTGQELRLLYTLTAGQYLDVSARNHTIVLGGTENRYSVLDSANSDWWQLEPGANEVRLLAASYSTGAKLTVTWRHAWL